MKNLKKALAFTLSLALCFTMAYTGIAISASAETSTTNNSIINGDFSTNTLFGYDVSENVSNDDAISVNDEACYIPERTDASSDGAYNRWINQKVTLANGKYIFSFDLDMTFSSSTAYAFAYSVKPGTAFDVDLKKPSNTNGTNYTLSKPVISTISSLNTSSEITSVPVDSSKFTKSGTTGLWNYSGTANTRYVGRVSVVVDLNNTASSTTELLFSIGCYSAGVSAYIDNISVEKITLFNGDFSNGLTGYDISANKTHSEAMTVTDGVCYIPTVTSTVANDKPYNRWLNQKLILENGKYIFSYDLDITYTSANAYAFAHAVRNADNMDANIIRPTSGSANTGFTVGNATVETLDYVLNTNDATNAAPLTNFGLSNSSKYYNYNGAAGRQVGRVSFLVTVNNTSADTTALYFSIGNYGTVCSAYIDNISVEKVNVINGDFSNGLNGYEYSANVSNEEAISVNDGVCYIPVRTDTNADGAKNRWINQKIFLENGKYIFSYDLDITYTSANAYAFAHAVRNAANMDSGQVRPHSGSENSGFTVENATVEALDHVLNTADDTVPVSLRNFALSNSSKYYNYNGAAGRQVGRVSFVVTVNNTSALITPLYFSIGNYEKNACTAYIDNVSVTAFDGDEIISNGDFEEGKTGYLYADDDNSQVEIYNDSNTTRPGYGTVDLDGNAAYITGSLDVNAADRKNYLMQYKMSCLPAGQYTFDMDVALNLLQNSNKLVALAFGVTDAINANGCVYGNRLINSTGTSSDVQFTDYNVRVTENGERVSHHKSHLYHRVGSWALGEELGWHNLHISITFKTTQAKTLYFFAGCAGDGVAENMIATAYIDNVSLHGSATVNYTPVNVKGKTISWTTTDYHKLNSIVSKHIEDISNYNLMGYKVGAESSIVNSDIYETIADQDGEITCVYALRGDLNDDLYLDSLDLSDLIGLLLGRDIECNMASAQVNSDDLIDIRDLIGLKKIIVNAVANDGDIVNVDIEHLRDPYVLLDDGVYYMYGTGGQCYKNTSRSLSGTWQSLGCVVETPADADGYYFWAPEVYKYNEYYYMITSYHSSVTEHRGCAVFRSDSPEGTFVQISSGTITPTDKDCIDGTLYFDNNDQPWMIFSEESVDNSIGRMLAAQMSADLTSLTTTPVELFRADAASWSSGRISEGPYMYRCEDGELLMIWSGFQYVDGEYLYCVGVAHSDNGDIDGNWSQDNTLLYSKELSGIYDGGHGMIFKSLTGQLYISVHSPNDTDGVDEKPVLIPIKEENGTLVWDVD